MFWTPAWVRHKRPRTARLRQRSPQVSGLVGSLTALVPGA